MRCKHCGHSLKQEDRFCPNCGTQVERKPQKQKNTRWITVAIVVVAVLLVLALVLIGILAVRLWKKASPAGEEAVEQVLEELNALERRWTDDNGCVPEEDLEECLDEAYQVLKEDDTVTYCEKNEYCVYFECEDDFGYVYMPELEDFSAGGEELQIITVQPYFTENLRQDKEGKYDHYALDSVAGQISDSYSRWSFDSRGSETDDNVDDAELTVEQMLSLDDYKLILWQGHGGYTQRRGYIACTTIESTRQIKKEYKELFKNKYIISNIVGTLYFTEAFFENCFADNAFEGAVVYMATCLSGYTEDFANTLLEKGAAAVYVNSESIYREYNLEMVRAVGESLCQGDSITQALEKAKAQHGESEDIGDGKRVYVYCLTQNWARRINLEQISQVLPLTDYKIAYINLLLDDVLPHAAEDMPYREYTLYDINLDGIPECVVDYGTCEEDRTYRIYTADGSSYVYLGAVSSSHSTLYGEVDGGITVMSGHLGLETCRQVEIENWMTQETQVYSRKEDRYWEERCQMQPLSMYDLADFTGFLWDGNPGYDNWAALNTDEPAPDTPVVDKPVPDTPTQPAYVTAYSQLLMQQVPVMGGSDITQYFTLYDIDLDGIPECLIEQGWGRGDRTCDVYTLVGTETVYLGSFHTNYSTIYGETTGGLTVMSGDGGMETCRTIAVADGTLQETIMYMAEVETYWNELCDVRPLALYELNDPAGLIWNGNPGYNNWAALEPDRIRVFP